MLQGAAEPSSPVCVATVNHHGQQPPTCWDFAHKSHVILTTSTSSISLYLTRTGTTAYLSNHVQLNKINNRAHQSYTAGLAATVQLSVCLTTGVIRTSLHYQSITLKQPCTSLCCPARPACCHSPPRRGGEGGEAHQCCLCCLWTLTSLLSSADWGLEWNLTRHASS